MKSLQKSKSKYALFFPKILNRWNSTRRISHVICFVQSVHLPKLLTNHVASCCGVIYAAGRDESSAQNVTQWSIILVTLWLELNVYVFSYHYYKSKSKGSVSTFFIFHFHWRIEYIWRLKKTTTNKVRITNCIKETSRQGQYIA